MTPWLKLAEKYQKQGMWKEMTFYLRLIEAENAWEQMQQQPQTPSRKDEE
jgi:hypothetical protein